MTRRQPAADLVWLAFHAVGIAACHIYGVWLIYWVAFLAVELVGLADGWPMTYSVRGFLAAASLPRGVL